MLKQLCILPAIVPAIVFAPRAAAAAGPASQAGAKQTLNVLFIGNSFTGRHNLSDVVKNMAEAGNPGLRFDVTTVIYGGRRLVDHWRLGTQNFVKISTLTREEEEATIRSLQESLVKDPKDKYASGAIPRHRELLAKIASPQRKWDVVVLQSYRDDLEGDSTLYVEYAPKFAELIRAQGARVVLYETTPTTQNEKPLTAAPDPKPILEKERVIAALANRIGATVVPMALVAHHCQTVRPDLTLRFVNDAHLNQTMAYLPACTFYAALFDRSPEGLSVDTVTDIRYLDDKHRDQDRDGGPIARTFSAKDRADLQRIAWEGLQEFKKLSRGHHGQPGRP